MKALVKGIIIAVIAVGVVIPAGYFSFFVYHSDNITLANLVPENSTMVVRGEVNGTQLYFYNASNTDGVVIGVSMNNLDSEISATTNQSNGSSVSIEPTLYSTYRGYDIYRISNVSLDGLVSSQLTAFNTGFNLTSNVSHYLQNNTVYVGEVKGVVTLGSVASVKISIDALVDNANFEPYASSHFNDTANFSVYFSSADYPVTLANANVYALYSDFNVEMNNSTNAQEVYRGLSAMNALPSNYTYVTSYSIDGNWVNGTMAVGIGNYYRVQYLLDNLNSLNINYTRYLTGLYA